MWHVGVVRDGDSKADGSPVTQGFIEVAKPLKPQIEAVGYEPGDIKHRSHRKFDIAEMSLSSYTLSLFGENPR